MALRGSAALSDGLDEELRQRVWIGDHRLMAGVERAVVKTGVGLRPGTLAREVELG